MEGTVVDGVFPSKACTVCPDLTAAPPLSLRLIWADTPKSDQTWLFHFHVLLPMPPRALVLILLYCSLQVENGGVRVQNGACFHFSSTTD